MNRRILYLQYTNPAAYPPLMHSASMLAEGGWEVLLLGIAADGAAGLVLPAQPRVRYQQAGARSGGRLGALKYGAFALRALHAAAGFRPDWIYASDPLSAPAALAVRRASRARVLYHEHDAPPRGLQSVVHGARTRLAGSADILVAPAAPRLELLPSGPGTRIVVWNCPRRHEAEQAAPPTLDGRFDLVYHGSLSRDRLTPAFVDALRLLPGHVQLHIFGYETAGHRGYAHELRTRAEGAGLAGRVHVHGAVPERAALLARLRGHQLGISTIAGDASDHNLQTLAGASNKAFEYLALGMPLLISRQPAWQRLYQPGYAVDCDPADAASIAAAVQAMCADPGRARQMGEAGRARILADWNYEAQFAPVLRRLTA